MTLHLGTEGRAERPLHTHSSIVARVLPTGTRHRRVWFAALAAMVVLGAPATAAAQTTDAPPSETATEEAEPENPLIIDLENVTIDEDGTVRWTIETDLEDAELVTGSTADGAPTGPGLQGTGGVDNPGGGDVDTTTDPDAATDPATGDDGELGTDLQDGADLAELTVSSGKGVDLAVIVGSAALALATLVGLFHLFGRRDEDEAVEVVEQAMEGADGAPAPLEAEHSYAGASDAGAYEVGGAAYAQHVDGVTGPSEPEPAAASGRLGTLHTSMVNMADKRLHSSGQDKLVTRRLENAGSKMRAGEFIVMASAGTLGAFFISTFLLGWKLAVPITALVGVAFWQSLSLLASRRTKAFAEALPETLQLIAGSLRGGSSLLQSIQTVADEADDPTAEEFQRIITEARLGRDIGVSLRDVSNRMQSKDFDWVVTAIEIHREVGGDLAGILDRVGSTIRSRNRVRGQVQSLAAEGKLSGLILFFLPPAMLVMISVINPEYLSEMTEELAGQLMLAGSAIQLLVGGFWLRHLAKFVY